MSLKVFNLQCDQGHLFEGWFGSHADYDDQQDRGLLTCPVCQSGQIQKMPSAPRINSSRPLVDAPIERPPEQSVPTVSGGAPDMAKLQAAILAQMRQFVSAAEDVGAGFAQEARAIHEGEAQARSIRGTTTAEEREELIEEGVSFMTVPDFLSDDRLQ